MSRTTLKQKTRDKLNALKQQTGVGPQRLLKGRKDKPKGLNSTTIYHWMDGTLATANSEYLEWVLTAWQNTEPLEVFTEADLAKLDEELTRTGNGPLSLLRRLSPVPKGLTPDILHRVRSKRLKKLPAAHKAFIFNGLATLPDR